MLTTIPYPNRPPAFWPPHSGVWKSFEAEAFPVTAWRYDITPYTTAKTEGLTGWRGYSPARKRISRPRFKFFGDDTLFASKSTAGTDNYLSLDANIFNRELQNAQRDQYNLEDIEAVNTNKLPQLYRISSDTHNTIPLKDFSENFGVNFDKYAYYGGRRSLPRSTQEVADQEQNRIKGEFRRFTEGSLKNSVYIKNDEIHVHGPLRFARAEFDARGTFRLGTCEWLDLAFF